MTTSEWLTEIAERVAQVAAAIAILFACAVIVHQHSHQADRAPYVAVDDALGNVSASMIALGRNGFPASPMQGAAGTADPRRNDVQLNYGYAPFMLGAALDWMFGTSYPVLRGVHVGGLVLAIGAAWLAFRSSTALAPLLFTGIVAIVLWPTQWPMFRPDIGTALSAIVAIACAMAALRKNGLLAWLGTGFFAATAFGSHQIAWALVPWAGIMWLIGVALTERGRRWSDITIGPFVAVVAGGLLGLLAYARGIDWRLSDIYAVWTASWDLLAGQTKLSFAEVLGKHFGSAWGAIRSGWVWSLYFGLFAGLTLGAVLAWRRHPLLRPVVATVVPGALAALAYLLGIGFYRNWHSGYTLLVQLATAWAAVAALAAVVYVAREHFGERVRPWLAAATLVGATVLGMHSYRQAAAGTTWSAYAPGYVPFSEYEGRVFAEVPNGASAAGSIIFGLKSGTRHHLVQLADLVALLERMGPESRKRMLPDHLVLNDALSDAVRLVADATANMRQRQLAMGGGLIGGQGPFSLPGIAYAETSIVYAEPYGETRVMTRGGAGSPSVAIYDTVAQTWSSRFVPSQPLAQSEAAVVLAVKGSAKPLPAAAGLSLRVEPGTYLVEVDISARTGGTAIVTGSTTATFEVDPGQVNPLGKSSAGLALVGNKSQHVIVRAPSGIGHVGYFGEALIRPLTIKRIERLVVDPERTTPVSLPPLADWKAMAPGAKVVLTGDGRGASTVGAGIPVGYQLASPPFAVPADAIISVRFDLGEPPVRLALGMIDNKGFWIGQPATDGRLTINTRGNTSVRLLLANLEGKALPEPARFEFRLDGASTVETYGPKRLYVDLLARCFGVAGKPVDVAACK
ncbi:MAG: hypothetical protein ACKVP7_06790 [Hyphomicrobiaceae bacterium]